MRSVSLTTQNAGMTRLRRKGGANPGTLYDCVNGYITISGTIRPRPGTLTAKQLEPGTAGLVAFKGRNHVFTSRVINDPVGDIGYIVVKHPVNPNYDVTYVHFAQPFMGYVYAVVEFEDGQYFHYWLEETLTWEANASYTEGQVVQPTVPNGYGYEAIRDTLQNPAWSPDVSRSMSERVEPTAPNGFYYRVVAVTGSNPRSGDTEPLWPTVEGQRVIESQSVTYVAPPPQTAQPPSGGSDGRYGNPNFGLRDSRIIE